MRTRLLIGFALTALVLGCASQASADVMTELVLDDGLGDVVTVDVSGGIATVTYGACPNGCAATPFTTGDHKSLVALATIGQFEINATGKGGLALFSPTLQDLNQINATALGAGTLTTTFTDTAYTNFSLGGFVLNAAGLNDAQINSSKVTFQAYTDAGNAIPAGALIGQFTDLTGSLLGTSGTFPNPTGSTSGSLTERTVMNFSGAGTVQANFAVANVSDAPEPGTIALFGSGLLALAGTLRRKILRMPETDETL